MTTVELQTDFKLTTDTSYLAFTGELWGVCCEDLCENWLCYNGTALYFHHQTRVGNMEHDMASVSILHHMAGANITKSCDKCDLIYDMEYDNMA